MGYLVNLDLRGRRALVAGGGPVAARKVRGLLEAGAVVTVVAARASAEIEALAREGRLALRIGAYAREDLAGAFIAIAATDDESVNRRISEEARAAGVLVNVVDRPELCNFTLPAVVRRGDLSLAVATEGKCPALARALREDLERAYGPVYGDLLDLVAELRRRMIARGWESRRIQEALSGVYRGGAAGALASGDRARLEALLRERLGAGFPLP